MKTNFQQLTECIIRLPVSS